MEAFLQSLLQLYQNIVPEEIRRHSWILKEIVFSPWPYLLIVPAVLVNNLIPVKRDFKKGLVSVVHDFIWFQWDAVFQVVFMAPYVVFLKFLYDHTIRFTVPVADSWPLAAKFLFTLLIYDFLQWLHHLIRHKVLFLWYFHTIHHSSRTLTIFTDVRVHPVEFFVARTLIFIPLLMFKIDPFTIAGVSIAILWYTRIYHADLRTNYGPLKYFMVTPQSHRIHHSRQPQHQDKNFGVIFTFWDRIFGTLYKNYDEYPETGISDSEFPLEKELSPRLFGDYLRQMAYPFRKIWAALRV